MVSTVSPEMRSGRSGSFMKASEVPLDGRMGKKLEMNQKAVMHRIFVCQKGELQWA